MEIKLYIILVVYFLVGGIVMAIVNKGKEPSFKKKNWVKYFVYLIIVNVLFIFILFWPALFHLLCLVIIAFGFYEILKLTYQLKKAKPGLFSLLVFSLLSFFFYYFSLMPKRYLFYTLFLTTVFDSFSQLTGQLFGKNKLVPKISPNKTYEGLFGGLVFALFTAILIHGLLNIPIGQSFLLGLGLSASAFVGDLLASYSKRKFEVKDFSSLIPGHGGVLDRFDSILASGPFMFLIVYFLEI